MFIIVGVRFVSCEQQLQQRLAKRRREVDPLLRDLATYRQALLAVLAHSPLAQVSIPHYHHHYHLYHYHHHSFHITIIITIIIIII